VALFRLYRQSTATAVMALLTDRLSIQFNHKSLTHDGLCVIEIVSVRGLLMFLIV